MALTFFVEVPVGGSTSKYDDSIKAIAITYLNGGFLLDLTALIPFQDLLPKMLNSEMALIPKLLRLRNGFKLLNYQQMLKEIKGLHQRHLSQKIVDNHTLANNQVKDLTRISFLLFLKYTLQSMQLVFVLICLSFLSGMIWLEFCSVTQSHI